MFVDLALHQREEQVLLALEVRVQRPGREARRGCDLLDRRAMESARREDAARGIEKPLACGGPALFASQPRRRFHDRDHS